MCSPGGKPAGRPGRAGKAAAGRRSPMKNQTFGIELETTGIGRERTAKALAAHF